jgi:purine-binding chemotaxis protein CheW
MRKAETTAMSATGNIDAADADKVVWRPADGAVTDGLAVDQDELAEYVTFAIGEDQYGVAIMSVREIKGWSGVTHLPKQPDYVRGVLNLRGVMVPIIDLRCRFSQGVTDACATNIVIIVQIGQHLIGLLADRVLDIVSFETAKIQPIPKVGSAAQAAFLSGLITVDDGTMIALIDLEHLLVAADAGGEPAKVSVAA